MARPAKKVVEEVFVTEELFNQNSIEYRQLVDELMERISNLEVKVETLEKKLDKPEGKLINKVEKFNDEVPSTIESYNGMKMDVSDKIISMQNAIKILPPNMVVNGRHLKENVEAIVGFKVSDEMMDAAYEGIEYDSRGN